VEDDDFMKQALALSRTAMAAGNLPVGSLIVRDGTVIGAGYNQARTTNDPTSHAEIEALRDACRRLAVTDLRGATCYTVMEPCPMCCWALMEAGISRLVLGARHAGMRRADYGGYSVEKLLAMTGRRIELVTGVLTAECEALRRSDPNWIEPA